MSDELTNTVDALDYGAIIADGSAILQSLNFGSSTSSWLSTGEGEGGLTEFGTSTDTVMNRKAWAAFYLNFGTSDSESFVKGSDTRLQRIPSNAVLLDYS